MRPNKMILLVDADEDRRSVLSFTLGLHHYDVLAAASPAEAFSIFPRCALDLTVVVHRPPLLDADPLLRVLKGLANHVPALVLMEQLEPEEVAWADSHLKICCPPVEMLERIRVMSARKRGPRKGSKRQEADHPSALHTARQVAQQAAHQAALPQAVIA